jgi:diacylglycerol kinase family enzyme
MAVLPLGTGNALFHSMHKPLYSDIGPTPLVHGLRTLFQGAPADLPVFRASFSPGSRIVTFADKRNTSSQTDGEANFSKEETSVSHLNGAIVASYGFHASIVYESDTPEHRVHGDKRFGMVAAELLKESHPYAAQVSIRRPGSSSFEAIPRDTHAYVLATLVSNLERTFTISPDSKPLQGHLRLVHFGPIGGERTMGVMMKAYDAGKHIDMEWEDGEKVGYDQVDEVRVIIQEDAERWRKVCIDGTIVEIPKGGQMSVSMLERGPLRILADCQVLAE